MKTSRVVLCFLATSSFFVRSIAGQQGNVANATSPSSSIEKISTIPAPKTKLKIAVYACKQLDASVVSSAEKVTTEIFKESHVEVEWLNCPGSQLCEQPSESLQFRVIIDWQITDVVKGSAQVKLMSEHDSLGFAIPCAVNDTVCLAYVFYSPINRMALMNGARVAVVLGHVIAHEIGHALLGPNPHSQTGIMRAKLPIGDLERFLYFTSQQSKSLAADLAARNEQQHK